ncbi:MAG: hypothetical protein IK083_06205 [Abditibacteriota bacterium]|nr:hypothetical protein [Abditibacteriota bacterium]
MSNTVVCPNCLKKLSFGDVIFECGNRDRSKELTCSYYPRGKNGEIDMKEMIDMQAVPWIWQIPGKKIPKCPKCHEPVRIIKCRHCKEELPFGIFDCDKRFRFGVFGTTGSGKTTFLTMMLMMFPKLTGMLIEGWDKEHFKKYTENKNQIQDGRVVEATRSGLDKPWLCLLRDRVSKGGKTPLYSMMVFDSSGHDSENVTDTVKTMLKGVNSLVILFDPLTLPSVREELVYQKETAEEAEQMEKRINRSRGGTAAGSGDVCNMVAEFANYIRSCFGYRRNEQIDRDVAVVFTKFDLIRDMFPEGSKAAKPKSYTEKDGSVYFDEEEADTVSREIEDWLREKGENEFLSVIKTNFKEDRLKFFAVSSLGHAPDDQRKIGKPHPHRVLDPFIWMLWLEGVIKSKPGSNKGR